MGGARRSARGTGAGVSLRAEPSRGAWVPADIIGDSRATCRPTATRGTSARAVDPASYTWAVGHTWRHAFKEAADAFGKVSSRAGTAHQAVAYIAKLYRIESEPIRVSAFGPGGRAVIAGA